MYALLFLFGFVGFVGMAGLSFLHSGHQSHTGNHGSTGEAIGSLKALQHAQAAKVSHGGPRVHAARGGAKVGRGPRFRPWWALSPFDILAYCVGAGAVGEILRQRGITPHLTLAGAILGALVFDFGVAKPLLNALLKFETRQSEGLEGSVAQQAEAISRFDAQGRGLVRLALDGEIVQVLAHLDPEERERGVIVRKGDPVLVIDIDASRNTCRVTRELAS